MIDTAHLSPSQIKNKLDRLSLSQIKALLQQDLPPSLLDIILEDSRTGVQKLVLQYQKRKDKEEKLRQQWETMNDVENEMKAKGYHWIAGCDEVGRGPLAGPVVAASVILSPDFYLPGLNDSKKLSASKREEFDAIIRKEAITYHLVYAPAEVVDELNVYQASHAAIRESLMGLSPRAEVCLVDGVKVEGIAIPQVPIVKGDSKSVSIAAASVIAKVERDRYMVEMDQKYPGYGFAKHMGYGTPEHLEAMRRFGPCPIHRKTFGRVKEWV